LKDTNVSIVEDLTSLNMELLNCLKLDDRVQKTWTWNVHVRALMNDGRKVQVRPFQTLDGIKCDLLTQLRLHVAAECDSGVFASSRLLSILIVFIK